MNVKRDFRRSDSGAVTITMSLSEFRETVEWLELLDDRDLATHNWRGWLDSIDPPQPVDALSQKEQTDG